MQLTDISPSGARLHKAADHIQRLRPHHADWPRSSTHRRLRRRLRANPSLRNDQGTPHRLSISRTRRPRLHLLILGLHIQDRLFRNHDDGPNGRQEEHGARDPLQDRR